MVARLATHLLAVVVTLLAVTFFAHLLTVRLPGDPALTIFRARYGDSEAPDPERLAAIRRETGLDRGLFAQYTRWLRGALRLELGRSYLTGRPVAAELGRRLPISLGLATAALLLAGLAAVASALAATRLPTLRASLLVLTQVAASVPEYVLALVLMYALALRLAWLPVAGWGGLDSAILPVAILTASPFSAFSRLLLVGLDEHLQSDWVRTARSKGLPELAIVARHVFPHALPPMLNLLGLLLGATLAVTVVAESVFAVPGLGRLFFDAVRARDIPVVQASLLVAVGIAVVGNRVGEVAAAVADPRRRT